MDKAPKPQPIQNCRRVMAPPKPRLELRTTLASIRTPTKESERSQRFAPEQKRHKNDEGTVQTVDQSGSAGPQSRQGHKKEHVRNADPNGSAHQHQRQVRRE